jgi:hypothetical protein
MVAWEPSTREFETTVLDEFRAKLLEFCATWRGDRAPTVYATVIVVRPVPDLRESLDPYARRILHVELPNARFSGVQFVEDPFMAAPGHLITVAAEAPKPMPRAAPTQREGEPDPAPRTARLTLFFGGRDYAYTVPAGAEWLAVRRGEPLSAYRPEIRLPDLLNAVPAGSLLCLRFWHNRVELRRTTARPEYAVALDGRHLAAGQQRPLGRAGDISYACGDKRAVLTYQLIGLE